MFSSNTSQVEGGYQISRSLRFNSADSAYLNRTPASAGNRKTWTWSGWIKRSTTSGSYLFSNLDSSAINGFGFQTTSGDTFDIFDITSNYVWRLVTNQVFRDFSAWYHIVLAFDSTQATSSNRVRLYVNGSEVTSFSVSTYPTQNYDGLWNTTSVAAIGRAGSFAGAYVNGYITEVNFIDGQALTPSSFGETNAQTGVWQPKAYSGSYGTNGFYLNFSDNSNTTAATLGKDYSGNGNNWTPNNFSVAAGAGNDSLVDSPTAYGTDTGAGGTVRGNYCTWNPIYAIASNGSNTFSNGNLDWTTNGSEGSVEASAVSTMALPSTGKWYWEVTPTTVATTAATRSMIGIMAQSQVFYNFAANGSATNDYAYSAAGSKGNAGSFTSYGNSYTANDVIGVAVDLDNGKIFFSKNGTWQNSGDPAAGTNAAFTGLTGSSNYFPAAGYFGAYTANFGQRAFAYTAPSGFKALCTQNLPTPTIGATTATQAGNYFNPVLWTGTNANPRTVTGVGFQPDLVWVKKRSAVGTNFLQDAVRGVTSTDSRSLASNNTDAETNFYTVNGGVTAFTSDGFTTSGGSTNLNLNESGVTYVAWNWKANGAGSTNTAGSITSTVSANTTSGFSIATWTGTGSGTATIGHGLGVAPSMIILKFRNTTSNWSIYHASLGNTKRLTFTTAAEETDSTIWNNTSPTSTVFTTGTTLNQSFTYVAYCFAPIAGFSAFGSYTGNSSSDGPFIYCGFRPRYVLIKLSSGGLGDWMIYDAVRNTSNVMSSVLYADLANAEGTVTGIDFTSNGFKLRGTSTDFNGGYTYIYAAFAESPFKYALAR